MAKFKVLKHNQTLMAWLGIYSYRLNEPTNECFEATITYIIVINVVFFLLATFVYICKNFSDFFAILDPLFILIGKFY